MATSAHEMVLAAHARLDNITPAQAQAELASGAAVLLDVREPVEWEQHIEGAIQVPRGLLEFAADPASPRHRMELDPGRRVIVCCRSGARAVLAGATLQDLGYQDVANLDGGLAAWKAAGLPLTEHHEGV